MFGLLTGMLYCIQLSFLPYTVYLFDVCAHICRICSKYMLHMFYMYVIYVIYMSHILYVTHVYMLCDSGRVNNRAVSFFLIQPLICKINKS